MIASYLANECATKCKAVCVNVWELFQKFLVNELGDTMTIKRVLEHLKRQSAPVDRTKEARESWHRYQDIYSFLKSTTGGDVPVYISTGTDLYLYALIVPLSRLQGDYVTDILQWNFSASRGCGYGYGISGENEVEPCWSEPIQNTGSEILNGTYPIFYCRYFDGYDQPCYAEIDQRVSHTLDIHWLESKQAWCNLNDVGEVVPIAYRTQENGLLCCTLRSEELDFYLFLTNSCLVRLFEISRSNDWSDTCEKRRESYSWKDDEKEIYAYHFIDFDQSGQAHTSILRGFQIVRCSQTRDKMVQRLTGKEPKQYATFLIYDWKNNRLVEWPADPEQLGNYYEQSDLPYETSPAFFSADVLSYYRQHPERFKIEDRTISCRDLWSISYDVNSEGQVFAYIIDLARIPYPEQLRWKASNEKPKAGISGRAFRTDFLAEFDISDNPLESLKALLRKFPQQDGNGVDCPVWQVPKASTTCNIDVLGYVRTSSDKEWREQIQYLSNIIVDGFNKKYLKRVAQSEGCPEEQLKQWRSLKILDWILEHRSVGEELRHTITAPLFELCEVRNKIGIAHPGDWTPSIEPAQYHLDLVERCNEAMQRLSERVRAGDFSLS